ncbi:hypothetical protein COLO4_24161 [Corchorus olitorius]|uniref:Receptor-like serine/threonine-protein kinase n=1 Tax=Corchorus olitorius TaxID=93759 RepID=A0A1R3ICC3_9ROSI|nr:hypothetical protein COLO4_24161 [Corchorus olitorius]
MFNLKLLLLSILVYLLCFSGAVARNTLKQGERFNSSDQLVSQNGAVTLNFIKQEYGRDWDGKDFGFYLAINYTVSLNDPVILSSWGHPIWLANRENPIADESGVLVIDETGLKITHNGGNPFQIFSLQSSSPATNNNINLVLHDSGNLVLQHANSNGENITLWQSFDFPTDTFLPGMKLGFSRERNWSLSSWLTESIPAAGAFTLNWEPVENRLVVRLRDRVLWTSGDNFSNILPFDPLNMNYNFTNVSNGDEQYLHYTLVINDFTPQERRKNARVVLDYDGNLKSGDGFFMLSSTNCAGDDTENGCERWEGPIVEAMVIRHYEEGGLDATEYHIIISHRPKKFLLELMTSDKSSEISEFQTGNNGHNLNIYNASLINSATNSFSPKNLLGKGGFGPVFKGTLPGGQVVAIKRLSRGSGQGLVEFKNELILIAKLQHTNLVRVLGFCIQGEEKMLVYEYMPNKSLDSFIFDESKRKLLDWNLRFSIIEGIAQGLLYLHKYSRLRIIHRDLKLSNILLDENMNPKISDFGMARIYKTNEAEPNTNRIVGTYGYMAPEYAMEGIFSVKSDVYSFGVMMLEVVSGRKNTSHFEFDRPLNLVGYAWELWKHGAALELADPTISESCSKHQVLRCITLGLLCVEDSPLDRPTMSDVISMLNGEMQLPLPKHPAFSTGRKIVETNDSMGEKEMENYSVNGLSISVMDAR